MSNPSDCPDLFHVEMLTLSDPFGTWVWKRQPETKLTLEAAIAYARSKTSPWCRVIAQIKVWDMEGEKPEQNGCLPGLHCLGKSRDCLAHGCIRELKAVNVDWGYTVDMNGYFKNGKIVK